MFYKQIKDEVVNSQNTNNGETAFYPLLDLAAYLLSSLLSKTAPKYLASVLRTEKERQNYWKGQNYL